MRLEVFDRDDQLIARLDMDDAPLKMYPLQNFMRIHVRAEPPLSSMFDCYETERSVLVFMSCVRVRDE